MNNEDVTKKSTTVELTISAGYVQGWGLYEATRELLQNALDAHDDGASLTIERGKGAKATIYIRNEGTTLDRRALLLGTTSKADGHARGKFGEGLKLSALVCARNGIALQIRTGSEMWTPFLEKSDTFGSELLKVKIRPQPKFENMVEVQIHGISDADWTEIQDRLINIPGLKSTQLAATEFIQVNSDKILLAPRHRGLLFSRGLFVARLPDEYEYGYDLAHVQLDRDRKAADTWSLRSEITSVLRQAVDQKLLKTEDVFAMLTNESCGEAKVIADSYAYGYSDQLTKALATEFERVHGVNAVPVSSMAESMKAGHHGLQGKIISKALRAVVEKERGEFEKRLTSKALDALVFYSYQDLTSDERENLS